MTQRQHRILCIDDEASILTMRRIVLETMGYSVLTAPDGPTGLELLATENADLMLLDYIMPGMNGGEVAQAARQKGKKLPIIMVSALPDIPDNAKDHIDAYVPKGESPSVLLSLVENILKVRSQPRPEMAGKYVVFVDADRRFVEATEAASALLGYSRAEFIGKTADELAASTEGLDELFDEFRKAGSLQGEFAFRHRNGSPRRVRFSARVYPDGCMASSWEPLGTIDRT